MTVVIAGAGPTGITLACELARRGIACRVLDQAPRLFEGSRGKGISSRTQEVFSDLGVLDRMLADGMPFPKFRLYAGHDVVSEQTVSELLGVQPLRRSPELPYPETLLLPQWRTDEILYERLRELGGQVEFGTEVTGFDQDEDGVTVHTSAGPIRASHLIGCDGGRSRLRKALGVGFAGETLETERTIIGDARVDGLEGVFCHMFTKAGDIGERFSLWSMPGGEYYQFVATMPTERTPELTLDAMNRLLRERSGRDDLHLHGLRWISLYRVNVRMVDRYRVGRVLLAGDAAHVHSGASGQGMNTSVQDAYNLGWKLAAVLCGAPEELLDTYETERMPVAANVLGVSTRLHRLNFQRPTEPVAVHQLDVSYRGGPLAVDDRRTPGRLRAGDRAPDGLLDDGTRLFDVFRGTHFTLLAFGRRPDADFGSGVRVHRAAKSEGYDVDGDALVLVRPDGYVGVICDRVETVREYLERVSGTA
ncbi:FAD-dependent monooxygenase [Kitasatospora sp. NBC_01302]|uniref:FAD-dependent monooxygenase n=1 Tax=Kitasatospora sp. NBC_01302 TaxID=2903575 RepID=UPI002E0DADC5|nr:FAD-dependent monooxygenase [Kitasatospora sp. NBC_01302]